MLKKLLKGCLTAAMVTAMAVSVSAETTLKWSGNAAATLEQTTTVVDGGDGVTVMDMYSSGDLDLKASVAGDQWTGMAKIEMDFNAAGVSAVDDLYVEMQSDALTIMFGENDIIGIGQGGDYLGEIDNTLGWGDGDEIPGEDGWLQVSLNEVGLKVFLGLNHVDPDDDATGDAYDRTAFGVTFAKSFGMIDLGFQYVSLSTKRDENNGSAVAEESKYDGLTATEMALAVTANISEKMAVSFNYVADAYTAGTDGADEVKTTTMALFFDMGLSDTMGFTVHYGQESEDDGAVVTTQTVLHGTLKVTTGGVDHYVAYESIKDASDADGDDDDTTSTFGYTMKVGF